MKLDCVLTSCNLNPLYCDFIPMFIKAWKKLYPDVTVIIVLIAKKIPDNLIKYKENITCFEPIEHLSTAFTSQYIRLLYPCILNYKNGILITDMDIIPMNSSYYTKNIESIDNNKFIYYRDVLMEQYNEIAMCYNIALNKTWKDIFKINNIDDIVKRLIDVINDVNYIDGHGNKGWNTDQLHLYKRVLEWNKNTNNFVHLYDTKTGYMRLDRINFEFDKTKIKNGYYSDYHCCRPYDKYKSINDEIINAL
jgi:hypothetical protein